MNNVKIAKEVSRKPAKLNQADWEKIRDSRSTRMELARKDLYWFFHLYFGHYISHETANFQKEMMDLVSDETVEHLVAVSFRGSGKSTIISTAFPIWAMIGRLQKKYAVIVSQTQDQARQHLKNLRTEIESNDLFRNDFGELEEESNEWGTTGLSMPSLDAKITAVSRDQGIRGTRNAQHRPDLIISDDVEDIKTTRQLKERNKTYDWFTSEIINLGSQKTKYVTIGNLLHRDSLLSRLREAHKEDDSFRFVEYPLIKNSKSLWPAMYPDQKSLDKLRKKVANPIAWEREYMLRILADDYQIIKPGSIRFYPKFPEKLRGQRRTHVISIDPAVSEKSSADCTAIVQLVQVGNSDDAVIYVKPNPFNKRINPVKTLGLIKRTAVMHPTAKFVIESTASQETLVQFAKNAYVDVEGFKPTDDKRSRLAVIADRIHEGKIKFPKQGCEELIAQLLDFGVEGHDDLVDALTMGVIFLNKLERNTGKATFVKLSGGSVMQQQINRNQRRGRRRSSILDNDPYGWN